MKNPKTTLAGLGTIVLSLADAYMLWKTRGAMDASMLRSAVTLLVGGALVGAKDGGA